MNTIVTNAEEKMEKSLESMLSKFTKIRAGRANPSVLDEIKVDYYGMPTPLIQLASISIPEAKQLSIKPFDKTLLGPIEKAIFAADIGLTPNNNGETIFILFPPLTEERRKDFVKQVKAIAEETKVAIRNIRQDSNNNIKKEETSEDDENKALDKVQQLVNDYNKKIEELLKEKEQELMNI